jgi:hypothetical protein
MSLKFIIPLAAWTTAASAQPVEHPAIGPEQPEAAASAATPLDLSVAIIAAPEELDADQVRSALGAELGLRIIGSDSVAGAAGRLTVMLDQGTLRVVYQPADGRRIERTIAAPAVAADRVQLVTFLASNLVRDQVTEILAGLARPQPAAVIAAPPSQPEVRTTASPTPIYWPATIGIVPPLAADRIAGSQVVVGLGVHALVGMTDGSQLASISGLVDVQQQYARGVQVGGLGASAGRLDHALQVGGLLAHARGNASALQVGGLGAIAGGEMRGIQVGGLATVSGGATEGIQVGGLGTIARGTMYGAQIGGLGSVARSVRGFQVGGVTTIAERVQGIQIAGLATVGGDVSGMQVGVVNVAGKMKGVQIGVLNVSDDGDDAVPIGLLNISRNGRVEVDGWVESTRFSAIGLRHGPRLVQNMIALAWSPDHEHVLAGFGLGIHRRLTTGQEPITLDIDAVNWWTDLWHGEFGQLEQLRATVALPMGPVDLLAGAAANVYISDGMDESANFHPVAARRISSDDSSVHVVSWPSVFAGVRMRAR